MNSNAENVDSGNQGYGQGVYRRRILLQKTTSGVRAELEDVTHAFRLFLAHDGATVTEVMAEPLRYPFDTCPAAVEKLHPLIGRALDVDASSLRALLDPGQNCTHLYDLTLLAMAHAVREADSRLYDITVPDDSGGGVEIEVACDGVPVHRWTVREHQLIQPSPHAGMTLQKGFYRWACAAFADDSLEAAQVLQRGYFVAQVRRQDYMRAGGRPATADNMPDGACYSYNKGVVEKAVHTHGMARDFSTGAEQLLRFL